MSLPNPKRQCRATSRAGRQCRNTAIPGGAVCKYHGGAAPQVQRKAAERLADLIDPDRALREAARLAYFDPRTLFDAQGNLLPITQWPDDAAAAIGGLEVVKRNLVVGDGLLDAVHKVKIIDKTAALTLLFKHLGLLVEKIEHAGEITYKWKE